MTTLAHAAVMHAALQSHMACAILGSTCGQLDQGARTLMSSVPLTGREFSLSFFTR